MIIPLNPPLVITSTISTIEITKLVIASALLSTNPHDNDIVAEVDYTWMSNATTNSILKTNSMYITRAQLAAICSATSVNMDNLIANLNTIIVAFAQQTGSM